MKNTTEISNPQKKKQTLVDSRSTYILMIATLVEALAGELTAAGDVRHHYTAAIRAGDSRQSHRIWDLVGVLHELYLQFHLWIFRWQMSR